MGAAAVCGLPGGVVFIAVNDLEDDPMYGIDKELAYTERVKLFTLIEELVKWENSSNPRVINAARLKIARSGHPSLQR